MYGLLGRRMAGIFNVHKNTEILKSIQQTQFVKIQSVERNENMKNTNAAHLRIHSLDQ